MRTDWDIVACLSRDKHSEKHDILQDNDKEEA